MTWLESDAGPHLLAAAPIALAVDALALALRPALAVLAVALALAVPPLALAVPPVHHIPLLHAQGRHEGCGHGRRPTTQQTGF